MPSEFNDNWWNVHFLHIPFSNLPFQFWKGSFCSGISASPIKNQKYDLKEKNFSKFDLIQANKANITFAIQVLRQNVCFWYDRISNECIATQPEPNRYNEKQFNSENQRYFPLPSVIPVTAHKTVRVVMYFAFIPTHSLADFFNISIFKIICTKGLKMENVFREIPFNINIFLFNYLSNTIKIQ